MATVRKRDGADSSSVDQEQQFILRMPHSAAVQLAKDFETATNLKEKLSIEQHPDHKHTVVRYAGQVYQGRIVDLPCTIESIKTTDRKMFYKTADISQMMVCTQGEPVSPEASRSVPPTSRPIGHKASKTEAEEKRYQYNHGLTRPLKNVRKRRFRKTMKRKYMDMPEIEKEVKQLLRADMAAVNVAWNIIYEPKTTSAPVEGIPEGEHEDTNVPAGVVEGAASTSGTEKQQTKAGGGQLERRHRTTAATNRTPKQQKGSFNINPTAIFGSDISDSSFSSDEDPSYQQSVTVEPHNKHLYGPPTDDTAAVVYGSRHRTSDDQRAAAGFYGSQDDKAGMDDALGSVLDSAVAQAGLDTSTFYQGDDEQTLNTTGFEMSQLSHFPRDDLELSLSEDEEGGEEQQENVDELAAKVASLEASLEQLKSGLQEKEKQQLVCDKKEDNTMLARSVAELRQEISHLSTQYEHLSSLLGQSIQF